MLTAITPTRWRAGHPVSRLSGVTSTLTVRVAGRADTVAVTTLINRAYEVEAPFVEGPRVHDEEVRALMANGRAFLIAGIDGRAVACVMIHVHQERGYMGLLSVDPAEQRAGIGGWLLARVEDAVRSRGIAVLDITVISLRHELLEYYAKRGFRVSGMAPYDGGRTQRQPFHFVRMTKNLDR